MKFKIVENPDPLDGINSDEFKKDYKNLTMSQMCEKYNKNPNKIRKIRKSLNVPPKPKGGLCPKNYSYNKTMKRWDIYTKHKFYASMKSEEEAKKAVKFLKENDWNKELFQRKWKIDNSPKYCYFDKNQNIWKIMREKTYYTSTKTEEEAKKVVEFLKENDWNKEQLLKNKKKILNE